MLRKFKLPAYARLIILSGAMLLLAGSCRQKEKVPTVAPVNETLTPENAFVNLFLESAAVYDYISSHQLSAVDSAYMLGFYRDRNFEYAWFDTTGLATQAEHFINLYRNFREQVNDSSLLNPRLDATLDQWLYDSLPNPPFSDSTTRPVELQLTHNFFRYAERAFGVHDTLDLTKIGWYIPRRKLDARSFLDSVILHKGESINQYLPVHPLFSGLQNALVRYTEIARTARFDSIAFADRVYKMGDSSEFIGAIKKRLIVFGDLLATDTGNVFTMATAGGVSTFQKRYGLTADSIAGPAFQRAINIPIDTLLEQIIVNLERSRWLPLPAEGKSIFVNIPEYKLYARDGQGRQWDMAVVVGRPATRTVIFNENMKYVVFAPYWNVPYSIVKNEMGRSAAYFRRRNMEIIGRFSDGLPRVRQKPGPDNALGKVKFLFPNNYSIYLHDTPTKSSFSEDKRAFSHGCIRLEKPFELAEWILGDKPQWTGDSIRSAMNRKTELTVTLEKEIPVLIAYFTSWADEQGRVYFRNDVYGHDDALKQRLFNN